MPQVVGGLTGNQGMKERGQAQESHGDNKQVCVLLVEQPITVPCTSGQLLETICNHVAHVRTKADALC
jgi:hypothetical protein